jgi:hypothetical protein
MPSGNKYLAYGCREGQIYVKLMDANFNTIYEKTVGINDKKALKQLVSDLRHKGLNLLDVFKGDIEEFW